MAEQSDLATAQQMSAEGLVKVCDALSHPVRIQIIGILASERQYISELARLLNISRPLLYMHLQKLEAAGLVKGQLELSDDGKAMKYYEVLTFNIALTPQVLQAATRQLRHE